MSLTIVGLGPGDPEDVTRRAWRILQDAERLYIRTVWHPAAEALERPYTSFDALYDKAEDFESVYTQIVRQLLAEAQTSDIVYAVPGHPLVGENTVTALLNENNGSVAIKIIEGLSFIEPSLSILGIDGMAGLQIHDAAEIAQMYHPPLNPAQSALIGQVYNQFIASDLKLTLMNQYPDEHPAILLHGAGTAEAVREDIKLYEIDRSQHISHMTTLYLPPLSIHSSIEAFQETIAHLRSPEGCPWDRKQTHQSLRPYLLEETYEVLEALDNEDYDALQDELGDLLLQVVLHSQVAIDEGNFTMADIVAGINAKIIRRHPHVWGDVDVQDEADLHRVWEAKKQEEKADAPKASTSLLDGIPPALPALMTAAKIQKKVAKVGFDWDDIAAVIDKIMEEIDEVKQAGSHNEQQAEIGDLLFAVVNWSRWLDIDPEIALREANERFKKRFAYIETHAPKPLGEMTLEELDALWNQAKEAKNPT